MTLKAVTPLQAKKPSAERYKPTEAEAAKLDVWSERAKKRANPEVSFRRDENGLALVVRHDDQATADILLKASVGTVDQAFYDALMRQLVNAGPSPFNERDCNFLLSVVRALEPRDEFEAMLAAQMGAIHAATMAMASRLHHVETLAQQDSTAQAFNKLARTFALQMEALKRYRTGGEQKVTVQHQHVTVNDGGQAVVGTVTHGGRGRKK